MATKPTPRIPVWASGGSTTDPGAGKEAAGWVLNERPPANWWNWVWNAMGQWLGYFENWTDENASLQAVIRTGSSSSILYQNGGPINFLADSGNDIVVDLNYSYTSTNAAVVVVSTEADGYSLAATMSSVGEITLAAEISSTGAAVDLTSFAIDIHLIAFGDRA